MAEAVKKFPPREKKFVIGYTEMQGAAYVRNTHLISVLPDTKIEELLKPEAWAQVAKRLVRFDKVEVVAQDGSWYAELLITAIPPKEDVNKNWAKAELLFFKELSNAAPSKEAPTGYKREWNASTKTHRVIRLSDDSVIYEDTDKQKAEQWLEEFTKGMAA